jgi:hypothetical protein
MEGERDTERETQRERDKELGSDGVMVEGGRGWGENRVCLVICEECHRLSPKLRKLLLIDGQNLTFSLNQGSPADSCSTDHGSHCSRSF